MLTALTIVILFALILGLFSLGLRGPTDVERLNRLTEDQMTQNGDFNNFGDFG